MTIDKITYGTSRQIAEDFWEKLSIDTTLSEGDDPKSKSLELKALADEIQAAFNDTRKSHYGQVLSGYPNDSMFDQIASCTDIKVLETYKLLVRGKPTLQEAYDQQMLILEHSQ